MVNIVIIIYYYYIQSLDRIGNQLSESHIHLEILHNFGQSIKFLRIQMANQAFNKRKQTFICTNIHIISIEQIFKKRKKRKEKARGVGLKWKQNKTKIY